MTADATNLTRYEGGCHCGKVRFRVTADLAESLECNCSICTKKGFIHLIVPPERFELVSGRGELSTYEFNTRTAKHTFCRHCGMHPFYVPRSDPDKIDVKPTARASEARAARCAPLARHVRCLDGIDLSELHPRPFDGQNWEEAQARRGH